MLIAMTKKTKVKQISFSTEYLDLLDIVNKQPNASRYICEAIKFYEKYKDKNIDVVLALHDMNLQPNKVSVQQSVIQPNPQEIKEIKQEPAKQMPNISDRLKATKKIDI